MKSGISLHFKTPLVQDFDSASSPWSAVAASQLAGNVSSITQCDSGDAALILVVSS